MANSPNRGVQITIDVKPSFEEVGNRFSKVNLTRALQLMIDKFAFSVERHAKQEVPVDTGRLRSSISTDIGNLRAKVAPHTDYAVFVHEGTKHMKGRPFMALGESQAESELFGSRSALEIEIAKELNIQLR